MLTLPQWLLNHAKGIRTWDKLLDILSLREEIRPIKCIILFSLSQKLLIDYRSQFIAIQKIILYILPQTKTKSKYSIILNKNLNQKNKL